MKSIFRSRPLPEHLKVPFGVWDALIVFGIAWIGLPIVIFLVALQLEPVVPLVHWFVQGLRPDSSSFEANFVLVLLDAIGALGLVWLYLRKYQVGWKSVGWRKFNVGKAILYLLAIFTGFIILADATIWLVSVLVPSFNANQPQNNELSSATGSNTNLALIGLVLIPPIIEETVFRGFIFPAMAGRVGLIWGAVISSVLFGFAHLQANVSIYTFILGLLLCFMYVRLKSIFPGMALHMLNNFLAYIAISHK